MSIDTTGSPTEERGYERWLAVIVAIGLVLRVAWWMTHPKTIEASGTEYARAAQNLLAGEGYQGLTGPTGQFPLYAILMMFGGTNPIHIEFAGRVISLLTGLAIVVLSYRIGRTLFSTGTGFLAAAAVACSPVLIALSVSVLTESLYIALSLAAFDAALHWLRARSRNAAVLVGVILGLGYLTRPEAVTVAAVLIGLMAGAAFLPGFKWRAAVGAALVPSLALALVASPYVAFQSVKSGRFSWNSKSGLVDILNVRMRAGMSFSEAAYGLRAPEGAGPAYREGPWLSGDWYAFERDPGLRPDHRSLRDIAAHAQANAAPLLRQVWYSDLLVAPWSLLLALIGCVASRWWRRNGWGGLMFLGMCGIQAATLLTIDFMSDRYLYVFVAYLAIWCASAVDWGVSLLRAPMQRLRLGLVPQVAGLGAMALLGAIRVTRVERTFDFRDSANPTVREAGAWVRSNFATDDLSHRPLMMGWGPAVAFETNALLKFLPFSDDSAALARLHRAGPSFIVVRSDDSYNAPYARDWFDTGVPDACAKPAFSATGKNGLGVRVWTWTCPPPQEGE